MILPYSFVVAAILIIATALLPVGGARSLVALLGGVAVLYLWRIDRDRLYVNPEFNADLERLEQSKATLGEYDKDYTGWMGTRHGWRTITSFTQPVAAMLLFVDAATVAYAHRATLDLWRAFGLILSILGINFGLGY